MDQKDWKLQRGQWAGRLEEWQSAQGFRDTLGELKAEYGKRLLSKSGFTDLFRDAYVASAFAFHFGAEKVRLVKGKQPDFEIEVLGRKQMYEVVEADTLGRKRGDEIKHQPDRRLGDPLPDEFFLTAELAPQILETAAKRKDKDVYLPEWGLVIYLNPAPPGGQEQQDIEEGMARATAVVKDRFKEVWVLWGDTAYNPWCQGVVRNTILRPPDTGKQATDFTPTPLSALFPSADTED